jgi:hypothetical protein
MLHHYRHYHQQKVLFHHYHLPLQLHLRHLRPDPLQQKVLLLHHYFLEMVMLMEYCQHHLTMVHHLNRHHRLIHQHVHYCQHLQEHYTIRHRRHLQTLLYQKLN